MDYASSSPMFIDVKNKIKLLYEEDFVGNPSSVHFNGRESENRISDARESLARLLQVKNSEIVFTSSGTEANNLALIGAAFSQRKKGKGSHIITTNVEHESVNGVLKFLEKNGFKITYLPVTKNGDIDENLFLGSISDKTILITMILVNHETGIILNLKNFVTYANDNNIIFHTDAALAFTRIDLSFLSMSVDLMTISGHKIGASAGIGALYIKKGVILEPIIHGGPHERKRRAGIENFSGIVGIGVAAKELEKNYDKYLNKIKELDLYIKTKLKLIDSINIVSNMETHTGIICFFSNKIEGQSLMMNLDLKGIAVSYGTPCSSGSLNLSSSLIGFGYSEVDVKKMIRVSIGYYTKTEEIDYFVSALKKILDRVG